MLGNAIVWAQQVSKADNVFNTGTKTLFEIKTEKSKTSPTEYIFNGTDSHIELSESFDNSFSFCAWIKPENLLQKNMAIVGIPETFWFRTTTDRELQFTEPGIHDSNTEELKLSNQNWVFVSFVIDYPSTKIYVNTKLVGEFQWTRKKKNWKEQLFIGKDKWQEHFHGSMKNIQIFNEAISYDKIRELYKPLPYTKQLTNGLVFFHSFENAHRFFLSEKQPKPQTKDIIFRKDSIKERVAQFNGQNSSITFDELPIDNAVTISAWVKQNEFNRDFGAVAALGHAYAFRITGGGSLLFTVPQKADLLDVNAKLSKNSWHQIVVSFKETIGATFYIDGEKKGFFPAEAFQNVTKELQIGTNLWNDFYKGEMDDLLIWNRVLTDKEVEMLYTTESNFWHKNLKVRRSKTLLYIGFVAYLLLMLFIYILHWHKKRKNLQQTPSVNKLEESFRQTIFGNLSDSNFSVDEFAEAMHMSKTKLYNEVKSTTGKSPKKFIREIRIIEAARLLKETDLPVTEIIFETGFESRAYFNKCFKEKYNDTPSSYRKNKTQTS